jgi:hypothetical protein
VNEASTQNEAGLRAELEAARERVDALRVELRGLDEELGALETERQQFELLHDVCGALEKLDEEGAGGLFWEGLSVADRGRSHLHGLRDRIDAFQQQLGRVESARHDVLARVAREEENGDWIEDDLDELHRLEEQRKEEWLLERELDEDPARPVIMPWARGGEDDQRFRRSLALALMLSLVFGIVLPLIPLPIPEAWEVTQIPDRFTSLVREQLPPPVVQELRPELEQPEPADETPLLAEEGNQQPAPVEPKPGPPAKGILALRDQFAALADTPDTAKLGSQARITRAGEATSGRPTRSLVATQGSGRSSGIDLAALSRNTSGGGGIQGVEASRATSSIGGNGTGSDRPLAGGPGSSRTDEEIQIVFDRHKSGLYRLYNRELRKNPTLQGQMVLRITIEPDGSVSLCELQSTDMKAPNLAARVLDRVSSFDFGAKEGIPAVTILYPIDFLPAT